jgi:hypothetical protein
MILSLLQAWQGILPLVDIKMTFSVQDIPG